MERKQKSYVKTTRAKTWTSATLFFEAQVKACFFPQTTIFVENPPQQQNFWQQNSEICDLSEKFLFVSKDFSRSVIKKQKSKFRNKISSQGQIVIFQHFSCWALFYGRTEKKLKMNLSLSSDSKKKCLLWTSSVFVVSCGRKLGCNLISPTNLDPSSKNTAHKRHTGGLCNKSRMKFID